MRTHSLSSVEKKSAENLVNVIPSGEVMRKGRTREIRESGLSGVVVVVFTAAEVCTGEGNTKVTFIKILLQKDKDRDKCCL